CLCCNLHCLSTHFGSHARWKLVFSYHALCTISFRFHNSELLTHTSELFSHLPSSVSFSMKFCVNLSSFGTR
ncbi:hypothetical protein PFISCL1PPCAC_3018, partial [Pristionchus fissidentatus]